MNRFLMYVLLEAFLAAWWLVAAATADDGTAPSSLVFDGYELVLQAPSTNLVMYRLPGTVQPTASSGESLPLPPDRGGRSGFVIAGGPAPTPRVSTGDSADTEDRDSGLWILGSSGDQGESRVSGWGWLADGVSASRRAENRARGAGAPRGEGRAAWTDPFGLEGGSRSLMPAGPEQDPFLSGRGMSPSEPGFGIDRDRF